MTALEKSILATIAYYDIFDYPLTGFEIWRFLIRPEGAEKESFRASEVFEALHKGAELQDHLGHRFGFYCLAKRERIVEKRLYRKKRADRKWKKLRPVFRLLVLVPFVRGIFVSGSLAMENSKEDSDVDIIVVAKHGRIWTVRTFMTVLTSCLGVRRHGKKTRDRICLNHYITDQSLLIPFPSLYNAQSYAHLLSIYREDEAIFRRFQEENLWLREYLARFGPARFQSARAVHKSPYLSGLSRLGERMLSGRLGEKLEKIFSSWESRRIKKDPLFRASGGRITIDENQLEFHPASHEHFIIPEFNRRMREMGLTEFADQKDSGLNK